MEGRGFSNGRSSLAATIAGDHLDDYMSSWSTGALFSPRNEQQKSKTNPPNLEKIKVGRKTAYMAAMCT
jgi:hypothetical protein